MCNKVFRIAEDQKYDGWQSELASVVYKVFHKTSSSRPIKTEIISNKQLVEELQK